MATAHVRTEGRSLTRVMTADSRRVFLPGREAAIADGLIVAQGGGELAARLPAYEEVMEEVADTVADGVGGGCGRGQGRLGDLVIGEFVVYDGCGGDGDG